MCFFRDFPLAEESTPPFCGHLPLLRRGRKPGDSRPPCQWGIQGGIFSPQYRGLCFTGETAFIRYSKELTLCRHTHRNSLNALEFYAKT